MGSLSLGILATHLDIALSCCSHLETCPAWSRHWTRDLKGTSLVAVSFPAPGTSMLSAKPLLEVNGSLQQEPRASNTTEQIPGSRLSHSPYLSEVRCLVGVQFSAPFLPRDLYKCSHQAAAAATHSTNPLPPSKIRSKSFQEPRAC